VRLVLVEYGPSREHLFGSNISREGLGSHSHASTMMHLESPVKSHGGGTVTTTASDCSSIHSNDLFSVTRKTDFFACPQKALHQSAPRLGALLERVDSIPKRDRSVVSSTAAVQRRTLDSLLQSPVQPNRWHADASFEASLNDEWWNASGGAQTLPTWPLHESVPSPSNKPRRSLRQHVQTKGAPSVASNDTTIQMGTTKKGVLKKSKDTTTSSPKSSKSTSPRDSKRRVRSKSAQQKTPSSKPTKLQAKLDDKRRVTQRLTSNDAISPSPGLDRVLSPSRVKGIAFPSDNKRVTRNFSFNTKLATVAPLSQVHADDENDLVDLIRQSTQLIHHENKKKKQRSKSAGSRAKSVGTHELGDKKKKKKKRIRVVPMPSHLTTTSSVEPGLIQEVSQANTKEQVLKVLHQAVDQWSDSQRQRGRTVPITKKKRSKSAPRHVSQPIRPLTPERKQKAPVLDFGGSQQHKHQAKLPSLVEAHEDVKRRKPKGHRCKSLPKPVRRASVDPHLHMDIVTTTPPQSPTTEQSSPTRNILSPLCEKIKNLSPMMRNLFQNNDNRLSCLERMPSTGSNVSEVTDDSLFRRIRQAGVTENVLRKLEEQGLFIAERSEL